MSISVSGIHHVTAIAGDPQANLDFYAGVLGLRLVKRTVNFDDPGTYHLYYGDRLGSPGSVLTFFPWGKGAVKGGPGLGQVTRLSFSVPPGSLPFWKQRLAALGVAVRGPFSRFGESLLELADPDGIAIELVAAADAREGYSTPATPPEVAIRGFHAVSLAEEAAEGTLELLESVLGFRRIGDQAVEPQDSGESGRRLRLAADGAGYVDLHTLPTARPGVMGVGAVHHLAFRVPTDEAQEDVRARLARRGVNVTSPLDRQYFRSIYFREPGGVLFEVATDPPGFLRDESEEELGRSLRLPDWYEKQRGLLEEVLPALRVPSAFTEEKRV